MELWTANGVLMPCTRPMDGAKRLTAIAKIQGHAYPPTNPTSLTAWDKKKTDKHNERKAVLRQK